MQEKRYKSKNELLTKAKESVGVSFGEIDKYQRLSNAKNKGCIGQMIEESWFEIAVNSRKEADFKELNVELKVTPCVKVRSGRMVAKERLILGIINYMTICKEEFETSSFLSKNQSLLLMYYEYIKDVDLADLKMVGSILYEYPAKDLIIIKQDWEKIANKIKEGKAHELSEGDTLYLGACTKGATSESSYREQPFSEEKAKQRAFSLKQSYMTHILNEYVLNNEQQESIIKNNDELKTKTFEEIVLEKFLPFYGKTQRELVNEFSLNITAKNINERILASILGIKGSIAATEEFQKANIIPKTIRINPDYTITESMSFPTFKFKEIIEENWEDSYMYNLFSQTKFMFILFKYNKNNDLFFEKVLFWNMPVKDINEVKKVWEETIRVIKEGVKIETRGNRDFNNLPGMSFNPVSHVRPHAKNKQDCYELPNGEKMPKQCFWLSHKYIEKQVL